VLGEGLLEDRRVAGEAVDLLVGQQRGQVAARLQVGAADGVQPHGLAELAELLERVHRSSSSSSSRKSSTASATSSGVKPKWASTSAPGADTPNSSMPMVSSAQRSHPKDVAASTETTGTSVGSTSSW